jgi:ribonuclease HI
MGRKEEAFVRALLGGLTFGEAAREATLPEERARRFLESVAGFAGTVGSVFEFGTPGSGRGEEGAVSEVVIHTDGASLGNPGPSGAGGVITTPTGEVVEEFHEHLGHTTNNVAEYEAVRIGIARAIERGARRVLVRLDSELVAKQLSGQYKVKDKKLVDAYLRVGELLSRLDEVQFQTIPREENARADALAKMGARRGPEKTRRPSPAA